MLRIVSGSVPVLLALLAVGCGDSLGGRQEVTGNVLYKTRPLDDGMIEFLPMDNQGTKSGAGIKNGKYEIPREKGLTPGRYKVVIYGGDGTAGDGNAEPSGRRPGVTPGKERIPVEYNEKSDKVREVTKAGPNQFDFDIK